MGEEFTEAYGDGLPTILHLVSPEVRRKAEILLINAGSFDTTLVILDPEKFWDGIEQVEEGNDSVMIKEARIS